VRETDTVARFGGDEFVVLIGELDGDMPHAGEQAGAIARKMALALAVPYVLAVPHEIDTDARLEHRCTVSIGVALLGTGAGTVDRALGIADQAMYQAKQAGRNSICLVEVASDVDGRAKPVPGWSGQDWSASDGS
jgi:diguanylate cyclase (GGDEF)-like protein